MGTFIVMVASSFAGTEPQRSMPTAPKLRAASIYAMVSKPREESISQAQKSVGNSILQVADLSGRAQRPLFMLTGPTLKGTSSCAITTDVREFLVSKLMGK